MVFGHYTSSQQQKSYPRQIDSNVVMYHCDMPDHVLERIVEGLWNLVPEKQLIVKSSVGYSVDS